MARNYSNIALDTTLSAGILAGDLSLTVASAAGWPLAPFAAVLDPGGAAEEVVQVTVKAGTTWTITRAFDGTTAAAHLAGVTVRHAAIAGDFTDLQTADAANASNLTTHEADTTNVHGIADTAALLTSAAAAAAYQPLDSTLTALAAYNTNGLLTQTAADIFTGRTITGTSNRLSVSDGNGVAGNPTLDIDSSYVGQSSITTLGTIATGTWQGTLVSPTYGGTGVNNGSNLLTVPATGTAALLGVANVFSANNRFNANVGIGQAPTVALEVSGITWIHQPTNGADGIRIFRATDTAPTGTLMLGMNAANNDEFWRFDADGNFIVVDIDGDNLATIARQDDAVYIDLTRSTNTGTVIFGKVFGDTQARLLIRADGLHEWGAGGASARDTNLYRSATNTLTTDDNLTVGLDLEVASEVRIGGITDSVPLAVFGANGEMRLTSSITDAANKTGRMTVKHYTNAEEPTLAFLLTVTNTSADLQWGGGSSVANTATRHSFYTSATNTTLNGTKRVEFSPDGGAAFGDALSADSGPRVVIKPESTTRIGLAVRRFSSGATALTQEWQNESGTFLSGVDKSGFLGIGGTPLVPIHIFGTNGELRIQNSATDVTTKQGRLTLGHYTNAEEAALVLLVQSFSGSSVINYGGASSTANTMTHHRFFTAADNITVTGTQRMEIGTDGGVAIGDALGFSSTAQLLIKANADARIGLAVRANSASQSSNLQAWQNSSGTALAFVTPGGGFVFNETAADVDCRIEGDTDANLFYTDASTDRVGIGTATPASKLHALLSDATTNAVDTVLTIGHNSTGTAAAGFGGALLWTLESSTTNDQSAASWGALWATATHASRKAQIVGSVYDTAAREWIRGEASGTAAMIGFLGAAASARQTGGENATNNVTSGGTTGTIDNWTDLTTYATDAAAIRNAVYQLARLVKQDHDALRLYGLLT